MNPLITKIQESAKAFEEQFKCIQSDCDGNGCIPHQVADDEWEAQQCQFHAEYLFPINDFHRSSLISLFQANIERLEKEKIEISLIVIGFDGVTKKGAITEQGYETLSKEMEARGFNQAIDQEIAFMRETIKSLENE